MPGGNRTVPPPAAAAVSIALLMAAVSSVLPSPLAPKALMSYSPVVPASEGVRLGMDPLPAAATATTPELARFRKYRRPTSSSDMHYPPRLFSLSRFHRSGVHVYCDTLN